MGYWIVLSVAVGVTLLTTPLIRWVAIRIDAVKRPGPRDVHVRPVPELGGLAMFAGFAAAMGVASMLHQFNLVFQESSEIKGVVVASVVMVLVGALDDLQDVSPPAKLAGMILAASLLARFGVTMYFFRVPFNLFHQDVVVLSPDIAPLITVLWVVLLANAINLIDGLDGLAAGIVMIAGAAFYLFARELYFKGNLSASNVAPLVAIVTVGVCAGFLPWNFRLRGGARIMMGDTGALFLGLLVAVPTITVGGRTDFGFVGNTYFFFAPLLIPLLILGVPIADTVFSFVRRVASGRGWSTPDREHVHHRLMRMGHGPRRTVVLLWAWTAVLSGAALLPVYTTGSGAAALTRFLPFVIAALFLLLYALFHTDVRLARSRRGREHHPTTAAEVVDLDSRRTGSGG